MIRPPFSAKITENDSLSRTWVEWFTKLWGIQQDASDTTANRPVTNLFVGRMYFDSTLGKPIWLKSVTPTVWVDATGASV